MKINLSNQVPFPLFTTNLIFNKILLSTPYFSYGIFFLNDVDFSIAQLQIITPVKEK